MTNFVQTLRDRMEKHARYTRTLRELERMPQSVADDLGIMKGDAPEMAYQAVYGA